MKKKGSKILAFPQLSLRTILIIVGVLLSPVVWFFCFGPLPVYDRGLSSMDELVEYNKNLDEFVKMDNTDLVHPLYDSYYKKHFASGFFKRLKNRVVGVLVKSGITSPPPFTYGFLKKLLEENTKLREAQNFKGLHVVKFNIEPDSKIIVVGVLQGVLHSFTRSLFKMQELGLMTKDFKLTSPKLQLFFLGNVINRTPFTTETLMIVLKIMLENPKQVFYMRGGQEFREAWMKYALRQELEMGARQFAKGKEGVPLMEQADAFFNTLPMEAYGLITAKKTAEELPYIVISAHIENPDLVKRTQEKEYPYFIRSNDMVLDLDKVVKKPGDAEEKPRLCLKATVRDIRKRSSYEQMDGLRALPPEGDATAWTVFSSPNASYRTGLKFFYDAFTVITPADSFADWKITLYNRNVEKKDAVFGSREEPFLVGSASAKAADGKAVVAAPAPVAEPAKPVAPAAAAPVAQAVEPAKSTVAPVSAAPAAEPVKPAAPVVAAPAPVAVAPAVEPAKPAAPAATAPPAQAPEQAKPAAAPVEEPAKPAAPVAAAPAAPVAEPAKAVEAPAPAVSVAAGAVAEPVKPVASAVAAPATQAAEPVKPAAAPAEPAKQASPAAPAAAAVEKAKA